MSTRPAVTLSLLRASVLVELEHVAVFDDDGVFDSAGFHGHLRVAAEVAIVAVDGDEVLWPDEIDEQAHLFLAAVAADVNQAVGAVVVNHIRVAADRDGR